MAVLALCLLSCSLASAQTVEEKIHPTLQLELSRTRGAVSAYALLEDQANVRAVVAASKRAKADVRARGEAVVSLLKRSNQLSQKPVVARIEALPGISNVRTLWIVNLVGFSADEAAIRTIAAMPEVAAVFYDSPWQAEQKVDAEEVALVQPNGHEPGHTAIKATEMWARGYLGFGGVAFTADTGVDPYHPAITHKYAGFDGRSTGWYDFNPNITEPFDCGDHGTHVTGTMLGLDRATNDTIGVAPRAHWIGAGILCGIGTVDNIGAFQWAIDPDGDPSTNDDRPTVINNSWQDPSVGSAECGSANPYPIVLDNLLAAGISVVFSAGNSGPDTMTITPPHNYNAGLVNAFTVGALNGNNPSYPIADFSSRGPSKCFRDSMPLDIKPEVSAPGQSVRSCVPGGEYGLKSGTSMAAPHTAGAVLLLHEAFPTLAGEDLQLALYFSAVDLGVPGEDNTYGRGIIDVDAAYQYLIDQGHTPAAPNFPALALMTTSLTAPEQQCGGQVEFAVTVRNEGTELITSIAYQYRIGQQSMVNDSVQVMLQPGADTTLAVSASSADDGEQDLMVKIERANGQVLDPRLDLGGVIRIDLSPLEPAALLTDNLDDNLCLGSPLVLAFENNQPDSVVSYFSTFSGIGPGDPFQQGPFIVPAITEPGIYYGQPEFVVHGGPPLPDSADLSFEDVEDFVMLIRATSDVRIRSFSIIAQEAGRIRINFTDIESTALVGRASFTAVAGVNRVEVGAQLEAGKEYEISFRTGDIMGIDLNDRIRGTSIADRIEVLNLEGNFSTSRASGFFFDWELGYGNGCPLVEVRVEPDSSRTASTLAISSSDSVGTVAEELVFMETNLNAGSDYRWFIGEDQFVSATSIQRYTPDEVGPLEVIVTAVDEDECLSYGETLIAVEPGNSSTTTLVDLDVRLLPNPVSTQFSLQGETGNIYQVRILDGLGRLAAHFPGRVNAGTSFDVRVLPKGAYTVILDLDDDSAAVVQLVVQ